MFEPTVKQTKALVLAADPTITDLMLYGGSRSGKTFVACFIVALRAIKYPKSRHVMLRFRFNQIKQSVWYDTFPKMLSICFPNVEFKENKSDWFIKFPNGSEVWFGGLDDKDRVEKILGNEYCTIYFNECSQIAIGAVDMAQTRLAQNIKSCKLLALYDCNPPSTRHWTYKTFEKENRVGHASLLLNPVDNPNLPPEYITRLQNLPAKQKRRFMEGKYIAEVDGALWQQSWIDECRGTKDIVPDDIKIVVAVDPAASTGTHGIIVCGYDGTRYYLLEDASMQGTPNQWGRVVRLMYEKYHADAVVVEINNGGKMCVSTIKGIDKTINVKEVRASKGKIPRADPISSFYEQGLVFHIGDYPELEEQMTTYTGCPSEDSPDRMDALVWGITYLSDKKKKAIGIAL